MIPKQPETFPRQPQTTSKLKLINPNDIEGSLKSLHKGNAASYGQYSCVVPGTVADLEWNHMDQLHRNYLHDAYHDSSRIATGPEFAYSITRWKNLPVFIQVFDLHVGPGMFYQSFSLFGLVICHQVQKMIPVDANHSELRVDWLTVSHKFFKFLHPVFNKMLWKLQKKQSDEDLVIRDQRTKLRLGGVKFKTDVPNFLNSNVLSDMVIFPELKKSFAISEIPEGMSQLSLGEAKIWVQKVGPALEGWPAVCPHEGAVMEKNHICNGVASCPWHGRKFNKTS